MDETMSDDDYPEAGAGYTAWGHPMPTDVSEQCGDILASGFNLVMSCVLLHGHDGDHESLSSSWGRA